MLFSPKKAFPTVDIVHPTPLYKGAPERLGISNRGITGAKSNPTIIRRALLSRCFWIFPNLSKQYFNKHQEQTESEASFRDAK